MARKPDDWMPLDVRKYLGDTMHLSREEHGAYLLLIMAYWMRGGSLADSDQELAAIVKASRPDWKRLRPIMEPYFQIRDGRWFHGKVEKELVRARDIIEKKTKSGKAGATARWGNDGERNGNRIADAMAESMPDAKQTDAPLPPPRTKKIYSSFVVGRKIGAQSGTTIKDPGERLNRFQKTLAEALGRDGYSIVGAAANPDNLLHARSLALCQAKAKEIGKGWPHQWPDGPTQ